MRSFNWQEFERLFSDKPDNIWFLNTTVEDILINSPTYSIWIPLMGLYVLKIPPTNEKEHYQILVRGYHYSMASVPQGADITNGKVYNLYTYPNEAPRWGNLTSLANQNPCANMGYMKYGLTEEPIYERMQSWRLTASIRAERALAPKISVIIAMQNFVLPGISATIRDEPSLAPGITASIVGDAIWRLPIRAAVRAERSESPGISAIVAHDFSEAPGISATIQGNPYREPKIRAAIKGEAETRPRIICNIVKDRTDAIMLEMELLLPQELDLRSTPQAPSRFKDYRRDALGG